MNSILYAQEDLPFVSIILPVFNEERYLESCLKTLKAIEYPDSKFEIITVDNGSVDKSFSIAKKYSDQALSKTEVNVGAVRNFGVENCSGDILAFLDSDCLVPKNWLNVGVQLLMENKDHVYGGNLYLREKPAWIEKFWLLDNNKENVSQHDLLGSCIFIQKKDFMKANGFDENVTAGEDSALSQMLKKLGYKVIIDPRLGVIHLGNPTTITEFVRRQIWHSENYIKAMRESLKDKVFWLVIVYLFSLIIAVLSFFLYPKFSLFFILIASLAPAALSVKRIIRANLQNKSLYSITSIYIIDNLYLIGRSLGFIKGIFN